MSESSAELFTHRPALGALAVWFALPGAVLLPFVLWRSVVAGVFFFALWLALDALLCRRLSSVRAGWDDRFFYVCSGARFHTRQCVPRRAVTDVLCLSTPLLRRSDACTVFVRAPSALLFLPALRRDDALRLQRALQEDLP